MNNQKYHFFWNGPLSNWYQASFTHIGIKFNCAEQAMMYCKAMFFADTETADKILNQTLPRIQKALGREVKNYKDSTWSSNRKKVVKDILRSKYEQCTFLMEYLLNTEGEIVEASYEDCIWGIGLAENDPRIHDKNLWEGTNLLGVILTELREEFKELQSN